MKVMSSMFKNCEPRIFVDFCKTYKRWWRAYV